MDIDKPDPTGPRQSTRISACKTRGLDYYKVETNIAFYLREFNAHYAKDVGDPITFRDVLNHPLCNDWFKSMKTEVNTLE